MNYIVEIEKLDHQGRGIGKLNGKIIFVDQALVGEKVRVEITSEKSKFYEGKIVEIINQSNERIESICPYFKECGGCDLLHIPYEKQVEFKQNKVPEILNKYSGILDVDKVLKPIIKASNHFNYRNKVTFHVKEKIGFYKRKSYELIAIDRCELISEKMNEILKICQKYLDLKYVEKIIIKDMANCQVMLTINLQKVINIDGFLDKIKDFVESVNIFIENRIYKTIGKSNIIAKLSDFDFLVSSSSFFQVNLEQTVKLYDKILNYCNLKPDDKVLDLYCGTGTIGIYLSRNCQQVLGIEINEDAMKDAKENKKLNNISNIEFICGDTKKAIKCIKYQPTVVVVDPPRNGLDKDVVEYLLQLKSDKVVYVSCDPITLARDLSLLQQYYEVIEITPIDLFPQTYHVECVCDLKLRKTK